MIFIINCIFKEEYKKEKKIYLKIKYFKLKKYSKIFIKNI